MIARAVQIQVFKIAIAAGCKPFTCIGTQKKRRQGKASTMAEKEEKARLNILPVLVRTPIRSLGTPRRVLVDSKGREVTKTPVKYPGTPFSNPPSASRQRRIQSSPGDWNTPSRKPCRIQPPVSSARRHSTPSKLHVDDLSSQISASQKLKQQSVGHGKEKNAYVLLEPEVITQDKGRLVKENNFVEDQSLGKENIPVDENLFSEGKIANPRTPVTFKGLLRSEWSRFCKREDNTLWSPALRVKVKDATEACGRGKEETVSVPQSGRGSEGNHILQQLHCKSLDIHVKKKKHVLLDGGRKINKTKEWL